MNREQRIASLRGRADAVRRNLDPHRPDAARGIRAIIWDMSRAPRVRQGSLLEGIGIAGDAATDEIVDGLAAFGCFLVGTNHLDDDAFRAVLLRILDDEVAVHDPRFCNEIIDLNPSGDGTVAVDRDSTLPRAARLDAR